MNYPSRNDDPASKHPTWNQSPPFLAADLTTCQDLNGIANTREHKGDGDPVADTQPPGSQQVLEKTLDPATGSTEDGARRSFGTISPLKTAVYGDSYIRLPISHVAQTSTSSYICSWITWGISVAVCSFVISALMRGHDGNAQPYAFKPTHLQNSTPLRKRSTCPTGSATSEDVYNTPLHVGAIFIILFVSTLSCSFPMIATKFPAIRLPNRFFFVVRHFGTGVLIATAFVHLLPTAFILLGDPCLSGFWTDDYPAMPGAIALVGIFLVALVEMIFHPARRMKNVSVNDECVDVSRPKPDPAATTAGDNAHSIPPTGEDAIVRASHLDNALQKEPENSLEDGRYTESLTDELTPAQVQRKAVLQCVLLEVGILFHSVFIGMTLSVSVGSEFVILLIAIAFHQTFEGLALGSRIASIKWGPKSLQPWWMSLAYGCTTPIGQAIGLATHSLYSPDSEAGLLLVGTMNAISSGLLTFASLIELLSEDFLSDHSWKVLRGGNRVFACVLVLFGAFAMSLVGGWA